MENGYSPPYTILLIFFSATNNLLSFRNSPRACASPSNPCSLSTNSFWQHHIHQSHFIESTPMAISQRIISTYSGINVTFYSSTVLVFQLVGMHNQNKYHIFTFCDQFFIFWILPSFYFCCPFATYNISMCFDSSGCYVPS
jgi:hypothetical protein